MGIPQDFSGTVATTTAITLAPVAWFLTALNWLDLMLRVAVGFTSLVAGLYAIAHYRNIRHAEQDRAAREALVQVVAPVVVPTIEVIASDVKT